jgi:glutaredoxin 3
MYCDMAKSLLRLRDITFEERNISKDYTKEQLLEAAPSARSVPQIFIDGKHIGGYTELKKHLGA